MKKRHGLMLVSALVLGLLLTACSSIPGLGTKETEYDLGEKVSTYWFDFTISSVEVVDDYEGYTTDEGYRLAVCDITIKNTFDESVPMNWSDFVLLWTEDGAQVSVDTDPYDLPGSYPIDQVSDEQLPDEYYIAKGETREGKLVFDIPEGHTKAAIMFQEIYEGDTESTYTEGDYYYVMLDIPQ